MLTEHMCGCVQVSLAQAQHGRHGRHGRHGWRHHRRNRLHQLRHARACTSNLAERPKRATHNCRATAWHNVESKGWPSAVGRLWDGSWGATAAKHQARPAQRDGHQALPCEHMQVAAKRIIPQPDCCSSVSHFGGAPTCRHVSRGIGPKERPAPFTRTPARAPVSPSGSYARRLAQA